MRTAQRSISTFPFARCKGGTSSANDCSRVSKTRAPKARQDRQGLPRSGNSLLLSLMNATHCRGPRPRKNEKGVSLNRRPAQSPREFPLGGYLFAPQPTELLSFRISGSPSNDQETRFRPRWCTSYQFGRRKHVVSPIDHVNALCNRSLLRMTGPLDYS